MFNEEAENKFFKMLALAPELHGFWDFDQKMLKRKEVTRHLERFDDHETWLLRFYLTVWQGIPSEHSTGVWGFDLFRASNDMEEREIKIVRKWLVEPFFC